jgi:hypothetical protein
MLLLAEFLSMQALDRRATGPPVGQCPMHRCTQRDGLNAARFSNFTPAYLSLKYYILPIVTIALEKLSLYGVRLYKGYNSTKSECGSDETANS